MKELRLTEQEQADRAKWMALEKRFQDARRQFPAGRYGYFSPEHTLELMKRAYNMAIEDAASNAKVVPESEAYVDAEFYHLDQQSILKLKL